MRRMDVNKDNGLEEQGENLFELYEQTQGRRMGAQIDFLLLLT
jgi:hypothetical protein